MDGQYLNKEDIILLNRWVEEIIKQENWSSFPEIHIDEINSNFKNKNYWVEGGLRVFQEIIMKIGKRPFEPILVIPLDYSRNIHEPKINDISDLSTQLYLTPPSIYILPTKFENFGKTINEAKIHITLSQKTGFNVYYKIEKEDDEYARTIYVRQSN